MNQPLIFPQPRGARLGANADIPTPPSISEAEREALVLMQSLKDTLMLISTGCERLATQLKEGSLRDDVKTVAEAAAHAELLAQIALASYQPPPSDDGEPAKTRGTVVKLSDR